MTSVTFYVISFFCGWFNFLSHFTSAYMHCVIYQNIIQFLDWQTEKFFLCICAYKWTCQKVNEACICEKSIHTHTLLSFYSVKRTVKQRKIFFTRKWEKYIRLRCIPWHVWTYYYRIFHIYFFLHISTNKYRMTASIQEMIKINSHEFKNKLQLSCSDWIEQINK